MWSRLRKPVTRVLAISNWKTNALSSGTETRIGNYLLPTANRAAFNLGLLAAQVFIEERPHSLI